MKSYLLIIAVLFSIPIQGQNLYRFGGEFGVSGSFPLAKVEGQVMSVNTLGFFYGRLIAERLMVNRLWLSSGVQYIATGFSEDYLDFTDEVRINNLGIPILARYEVSPERKKTKFFIQGGLYLNTAFSGNLLTKYKGSTDTEKLSFGDTPRKHFLRVTDFGWTVGFGWHFRNFILKYQYSSGIRNLTPGGDKANTFRNRIFTIGLGFSMPAKIGKKKSSEE